MDLITYKIRTMKNEKKQPVKWEDITSLSRGTKEKAPVTDALRQLEELQKRARSLGRSFQYGGYQGL
jgi:hypothetical protein